MTKTLIGLCWVLFLGAAQDDDYKIEAKIEQLKNDEGKPILRVSGTTNIPDKARFTIHIYYHRVKPGQHLAYRALEVKDGKFSKDFAIYTKENLPGKQVVVVAFNPYSQRTDVTKAMGKKLKQYQHAPELTIGTDEDIDLARERVHGKLSAELKGYVTLTDASEKLFNEMLKDKDRDIEKWNKQVEEWEHEVHEIEKRCYNVPEYKALGIADISESHIESLSKNLHAILHTGTAALSGKTKDPQVLVNLDGWRKFIRGAVKKMLLRLGEREATPEDFRLEVKIFVEQVSTAKGQIRFIKESPKKDPKVFEGIAADFKRGFKGAVFRLNKIAPDQLKKLVDDFVSDGLKVVKCLTDASKAKAEEISLEPVEKALKQLTDTQVKVMAAIDKWEKGLKDKDK